MKILIKRAKIVDADSSLFNQQKDILIEDGIISKIENTIETTDAQEISSENLHISQGWVDLKAHFLIQEKNTKKQLILD